MTTLSTDAQAVIDTFGSQPGVTQDQLNNLQAVFNSSPALIDQFNTAVASGDVTQFLPLPPGTNAGGTYSSRDKAVNFPLSALDTPANGPFEAGSAVYIFGHEIQHGINSSTKDQARQDFRAAVDAKAQETTVPRDYTDATAALLDASRYDESSASLAGWNALVGMLSSTNPNPSLADIYDAAPFQARRFIDESGTPPNNTYAMRSGFTLSADMSLSETPTNLDAIGRRHFDAASGLGAMGTSDYPNYYGTNAIEVIAREERQYNPTQPGVTPDPIALDMTRLGFSERILEENGIDLGRDRTPLPYVDTSAATPTVSQFDHTQDTNIHIPTVTVPAPVAPGPTLSPVPFDGQTLSPVPFNGTTLSPVPVGGGTVTSVPLSPNSGTTPGSGTVATPDNTPAPQNTGRVPEGIDTNRSPDRSTTKAEEVDSPNAINAQRQPNNVSSQNGLSPTEILEDRNLQNAPRNLSGSESLSPASRLPNAHMEQAARSDHSVGLNAAITPEARTLYNTPTPKAEDLSSAARLPGALINQAGHPDHSEFQDIRGKASLAFARSGRNLTEEEIDNASAQLLRAKKEKPEVQEVNSVMLSNATPRAAAGDRLFGVYEPNGPGSKPNEQANVITNDAIKTPLPKSSEEIDAINQKQAPTKQQTLESKKDLDAVETPAPLVKGALVK
jgi:hypothetical protein